MSKGRRRITVGSAKAKGRRLQKWVCKRISELTGLPWGKDEPIESRPMGQSGPDVRLDREAKKVFPFAVECKYCERWSIPSWVGQARENVSEGMDWLLFVRRNRFPTIVILDAEVFFRILEKRIAKR